MDKKLILASASPRRRELMDIAGYEYEVIASDAQELCGGMQASELVRENALAKAREVFARTSAEGVVVGADTVVCLGGDILGKPKNALDAKEMLARLSGSAHEVLTGYAVICADGEKAGVCETRVHFKALSPAEIDAYVATGEPLDKAGAYGIQERAGLFVDRIEGDYFNVIGLPVEKLYPLLAECGIFPKWMIR